MSAAFEHAAIIKTATSDGTGATSSGLPNVIHPEQQSYTQMMLDKSPQPPPPPQQQHPPQHPHQTPQSLQSQNSTYNVGVQSSDQSSSPSDAYDPLLLQFAKAANTHRPSLTISTMPALAAPAAGASDVTIQFNTPSGSGSSNPASGPAGSVECDPEERKKDSAITMSAYSAMTSSVSSARTALLSSASASVPSATAASSSLLSTVSSSFSSRLTPRSQTPLSTSTLAASAVHHDDVLSSQSAMTPFTPFTASKETPTGTPAVGSILEDGDTPAQASITPVSSSTARPTIPYAILITNAIEMSANRRITLNEIYNYAMHHYPYFRTAGSGWKNSIRHNLSLNKNFVRIARPPNEKGKGAYWTLAPNALSKKGRTRVRSSSDPGRPDPRCFQAHGADMFNPETGSGGLSGNGVGGHQQHPHHDHRHHHQQQQQIHRGSAGEGMVVFRANSQEPMSSGGMALPSSQGNASSQTGHAVAAAAAAAKASMSMPSGSGSGQQGPVSASGQGRVPTPSSSTAGAVIANATSGMIPSINSALLDTKSSLYSKSPMIVDRMAMMPPGVQGIGNQQRPYSFIPPDLFVQQSPAISADGEAFDLNRHQGMHHFDPLSSSVTVSSINGTLDHSGSSLSSSMRNLAGDLDASSSFSHHLHHHMYQHDDHAPEIDGLAKTLDENITLETTGFFDSDFGGIDGPSLSGSATNFGASGMGLGMGVGMGMGMGVGMGMSGMGMGIGLRSGSLIHSTEMSGSGLSNVSSAGGLQHSLQSLSTHGGFLASTQDSISGLDFLAAHPAYEELGILDANTRVLYDTQSGMHGSQFLYDNVVHPDDEPLHPDFLAISYPEMQSGFSLSQHDSLLSQQDALGLSHPSLSFQLSQSSLHSHASSSRGSHVSAHRSQHPQHLFDQHEQPVHLQSHSQPQQQQQHQQHQQQQQGQQEYHFLQAHGVSRPGAGNDSGGSHIPTISSEQTSGQSDLSNASGYFSYHHGSRRAVDMEQTAHISDHNSGMLGNHSKSAGHLTATHDGAFLQDESISTSSSSSAGQGGPVYQVEQRYHNGGRDSKQEMRFESRPPVHHQPYQQQQQQQQQHQHHMLMFNGAPATSGLKSEHSQAQMQVQPNLPSQRFQQFLPSSQTSVLQHGQQLGQQPTQMHTDAAGDMHPSMSGMLVTGQQRLQGQQRSGSSLEGLVGGSDRLERLDRLEWESMA